MNLFKFNQINEKLKVESQSDPDFEFFIGRVRINSISKIIEWHVTLNKNGSNVVQRIDTVGWKKCNLNKIILESQEQKPNILKIKTTFMAYHNTRIPLISQNKLNIERHGQSFILLFSITET